ncbi:MAG: hypothetical protein GY835_05905 [bacterium]|nr:hypothetical protein [bacterium]
MLRDLPVSQNRTHLLMICLLLFAVGIALPTAALSQTMAPGKEMPPGKDPAIRPHDACRSHMSHLDRTGEGIAGQNEWEVRFYEISGEVDFEEFDFDARVHIWLTPIAEVDELVLDALETLTISKVTLDGEEVTFDDTAVDLVTIPTPDVIVGTEYEIEVTYTAEPNSQGFGYGCFVFVDYLIGDTRVTTCQTMSERQYSGSWWPCIDRLTHKPEGVELFITVPDTMIVAANGVLQDIDTSTPGKRTYNWRTDYSIATYLVSMTVAPFADTYRSAGPGLPWEESYTSSGGETFPLQYFIWRDYLEDEALAEKVIRNLSKIPLMMTCFEELYGPYPFREEKYGIAEFSFGGGMEHQTISSIGSAYIISSDSLTFVQHHELAHQWFGDQVSPATWEDIWLNEGFATYSEALFFEYVERYTAGEYLYLKRRLQNPFPGSIYAPDGYFNATVYWKGAWALHMLRDLIGDGYFFEAMRKWADPAESSVAGGVATTAQFQEHVESISGRDLETFFRNWIYGVGRPVYSHFFLSTTSATTGWDVELVIEQAQSGTVFGDSLDIRFNFEDSDLTFRRCPNRAQQVYAFNLPAEPMSVTLDPDYRLLHNSVQIATGSNPFRVIGTTPSLNQVAVELIVVNPGRVTAKIYDVAGRLVRELRDADTPAGSLTMHWDGKDDNDEQVSASIYLCHIEAGGHRETTKLLLLH